MPYELEGTVKVVMPQQTFGSGFTKREFVVTTSADRYPQEIKLECHKDKAVLLDTVRSGDKVKVSFDIRGGEHNGRYFVNLIAWKISPSDGSSSSSSDSSDQADYRPSGPRPERPRPSGGGGGGGASGGGGGGGGSGGKRGGGDWGERSDRGGGGGGRPPRDEDFRGGGGRRGGYNEDDIDF
jgi:single-strand DNA-binding protein